MPGGDDVRTSVSVMPEHPTVNMAVSATL